MCLGKRIPKRVVREDFYEEDEFERILTEEYGVTAEELQEDIMGGGISGGFCRTEAEIRLLDGTKVTLYAETEGEYQVFTYLEACSPKEVSEIWMDTNNRKAIGSLIRYPGEQHEWLMVAALPFLKLMGIPLEWMREYRTRTDQCRFYYMSKDRIRHIGSHGGEGSGTMHIDLLRCYIDAYEMKCNPGPDSGRAIAENLSEFVKAHYDDQEIEAPESLTNLIDILKSES